MFSLWLPEAKNAQINRLYLVIVSFLMNFATFAVGLRCFADFDKDLKRAKTSGKQ